MPVCLHLDNRGRRCPQEAEEDSPFCARHAPVSPAESGETPPEWRKRVLRLAALFLLVLFLLPLVIQGYRMLKALLN